MFLSFTRTSAQWVKPMFCPIPRNLITEFWNYVLQRNIRPQAGWQTLWPAGCMCWLARWFWLNYRFRWFLLTDYVYFETLSTSPYQIRRIEELCKVGGSMIMDTEAKYSPDKYWKSPVCLQDSFFPSLQRSVYLLISAELMRRVAVVFTAIRRIRRVHFNTHTI